MLLGLGGDLERLQLTIGFIAAQFRALVGIIVIQVFTKVLSKAVLSVLLYNYLKGIVKTIVAAYRIVIIPLKDFLLQQYIVLQYLLVNILPLLEIILSRGPIYTKILNRSFVSCIVLIILYTRQQYISFIKQFIRIRTELYFIPLRVVDLGRSIIKLSK